jgi:hypothetical protein
MMCLNAQSKWPTQKTNDSSVKLQTEGRSQSLYEGRRAGLQLRKPTRQTCNCSEESLCRFNYAPDRSPGRNTIHVDAPHCSFCGTVATRLESERGRAALEETCLAAEAARPPSTGAAVALDLVAMDERLRRRDALEETYLAAEAARPPSTGAAVALDRATVRTVAQEELLPVAPVRTSGEVPSFRAAQSGRPATGAAVVLDRATANGRLRSRAALEETYLAAEAARPPSTGAAVALDLALALLQEEVTAATVADTEEVAESARGAASRSA